MDYDILINKLKLYEEENIKLKKHRTILSSIIF